MPRIVSLIASATEIVCALGFEGDLVAWSHECDYPPSVKRLPCVTAPKFDVTTSSLAIDQQVRSLVGQGLSVYHVDAERLEALEPDVIVTQSQCEVCAVSLRDVERAVCAWLRRCPQLVSLEPNSLADVFADIERVALALDAYDRGVELQARMRGRMAAIAERALLDRMLWVVDGTGKQVPGTIAVGQKETVWSFTPARDWEPGRFSWWRTPDWKTARATASAGRSRWMSCARWSGRSR